MGLQITFAFNPAVPASLRSGLYVVHPATASGKAYIGFILFDISLTLEKVMETETYKNAKLILERFDPDSKKRIELDATPVRPPVTPQHGQELRQRHVIHRPPVPVTPNLAVAARPPPGPTATSGLISAPGGPPEKNLSSSQHHNLLRRNATPTGSPTQGMHPPGPPLARPVLPRDRGALDKIIEYLVGDGPQNRYALICQQCLSHNGMALKEEFEYVAFRCAYCYFLNPARKTRPQAPQLAEFSESKTSPEPASIALETDQGAPTSSPVEDKCESVEKTCEQQEENQTEKPGPPDPSSTLSDLPEKFDNEQDVSAMEVE
ncbi:Protein lunapark-A [Bagarius yarrelli]|uniref:Endoplasmic reticulum junction formation protein lunapark n=1 Tax=Bagarius yarrelli TaxID=175774 RepID=A0A556U4Q1_BAGYA|nr:Protein lunapark-A [Bagarius yarrelli]